PRTDIVSIGTQVQLTDLEAGKPEHFTILGAWDSDPEKGIVSYLSPMAQALIGHSVNDQVEFEVHGQRHHHRIGAIRAWQPPTPDPAPVPAQTPAAAPAQHPVV